jgi:uncharacterized protein YbaR (Trm112 family)
MIAAEVLAMLRCPDNQSELAPASDDLVQRLNAAIREHRIVNRGGKRVDRAMEAGLVRADRALLYPVIDQIPILIRDDAIELNQLSH